MLSEETAHDLSRNIQAVKVYRKSTRYKRTEPVHGEKKKAAVVQRRNNLCGDGFSCIAHD